MQLRSVSATVISGRLRTTNASSGRDLTSRRDTVSMKYLRAARGKCKVLKLAAGQSLMPITQVYTKVADPYRAQAYTHLGL